MPNIAEQVINDVKEAQKKYNLAVLNEVSEKLLREQILDVGKPDHRIKELVRKCLKIITTLFSNFVIKRSITHIQTFPF